MSHLFHKLLRHDFLLLALHSCDRVHLFPLILCLFQRHKLRSMSLHHKCHRLRMHLLLRFLLRFRLQCDQLQGHIPHHIRYKRHYLCKLQRRPYNFQFQRVRDHCHTLLSVCRCRYLSKFQGMRDQWDQSFHCRCCHNLHKCT